MLAEAAAPGQILISHQTKQLAAGAIETDSGGPDRFLLRSAQAGLRPLAVRLDAPLVGRGEEIRRLEAAYARATRERVTMTVTVIGEAGIGKTRLVQEFAGGLGREAHVFTGRCLSYGEGITFWPLREMVRQAGSGDDSPERIKDLLAGEADAAAVAEQLHRALGSGRQGRTAATEIFWAARRLLEALARDRPVLVVFEDLHWAEPTLLDLVESLPSGRGDHRSSWSALPARNCSTSVRAGRPRPTGRFPSSSGRSASFRQKRCLTRCQRVIALPRPPGHGSSRPRAAIPSTWSNWRSPSASRAEAISGRRCRPRFRLCCRHGSSAWGREPAASSSGPPSSARTSANGKPGNCSRSRRARRSAATSRPSSPRAWCSQGPAEAPIRSTASGTSSSRRRLITRSRSPFEPSCTTATPTGSRSASRTPSPRARRSSAITSNSRSAIAPNCGPAIPSPPRCRSARPDTSRRPGTPRMTAATTSRR